jgi:hypothetical protein
MFPQGVTPSGMTYFVADAYNAVCYDLSHLKTEFLRKYVTEFNSYLTGNTLRLCYKDQQVITVWGDTRCIVCKP